MITRSSRHIETTGTRDVSVTESNFISCFSENGGGIFSDADLKITIRNCFFYLCNATTRGGALYVHKGKCNIMFICSQQCNAKLADVICWRPDDIDVKFTQCSNGLFNWHGTYFGAIKVRLAHINISRNKLSNSIHGIGMTLSSTNYMKQRFLNVVSCQGNCPVLRYESTTSTAFETSMNIVNNSNTNSYFIVQSSNFDVSFRRSTFVKNGNNQIATTAESTITISFFNCWFDFESELSSYTHDACSYGASISSYTERDFDCLFNIKCSQRRNIYRSDHSFLMFMHIMIISS